ncbi:MAG: Hsp70 family protein [Candidatus Poribacteria bacterium]|nr:Hsp70 family protein [Candidatus Poribacteria bacterium]
MGKVDYIGIDLGTTNSVIAFGRIDSSGINAKIIPIPRKSKDGRLRRDGLLPSTTYFNPTSTSPTVGDYAKAMIYAEPERVAKSMKCYMDPGTQTIDNQGGVTWTPIKTAAAILKHLTGSAAHIYKNSEDFTENKLLITVPTCFSDDMRRATIEAAESAGFCSLTNDNLVPASHAILHHYYNQSPAGIDFREEKKILVFDLGGGTLDVSLHYVYQKDKLTIRRSVVSDYTQCGGDNFDRLVAKKLLHRYLCEHKFSPELSSHELDMLKFLFQEYASTAKEKLSKQIERDQLIGNYDTNPCYPIYEEPVYLKKHRSLPVFEYELCWNEYECIITEAFLAPTLILESPCPPQRNNIIVPILEVLDKAKVKECSKRPKVDMVLLNGAMTKLLPIQKRLEKLFSTKNPPATKVVDERDGLNPEHAVALGAAVYWAKK